MTSRAQRKRERQEEKPQQKLEQEPKQKSEKKPQENPQQREQKPEEKPQQRKQKSEENPDDSESDRDSDSELDRKRIPYANLRLKPFRASDGATLFYHHQRARRDNKRTLFVLLGWSQSADTFSPVLLTNTYIRDYHDVYILVMRGLEDDNVSKRSNTIARYALDANEFLDSRCLDKVIPMCHSMGCSIIWEMISFFGEDRFERYILIDQAPMVLCRGQAQDPQGCLFKDSQELFAFSDALADPETAAATKTDFQRQFFTEEFLRTHSKIVNKTIEGALEYNDITTSRVLFSHSTNNWTNILYTPRTDRLKEVLFFGGKASVVNYKAIEAQIKYYKRGSKAVIFSEQQGGSHLLFVENPYLFNKYVNAYLQSDKQ